MGAGSAAGPPAGTAGSLVAECSGLLAAAATGSAAAAREAREIVATVAGRSLVWPVLEPDAPIEPGASDRARAAARRRACGEPLAYCLGEAAFRHLTLAVDARVLIPRPETERLVDLVLERTAGGRGLAVDVGTGSGAIALAFACEGAFARVIGTDLSPGALEVARANQERCAGGLRSPVEFRLGDLLAPVQGERAEVVASNPPYISMAERDALPTSVRDWEPCEALFAGDEGMAVIDRIARDAAGVLVPGGLLALEVDERRARRARLSVVATGSYAAADVELDLAGRERFVLARRM